MNPIYDRTFSEMEQRVIDQLEIYVFLGYTDKQIIAILCTKNYPQEEVETLLPVVKKAMENHFLQIERKSQNNKSKKQKEKTQIKIEPLELFPGLTQEEQTQKINELKDETRDRAEQVVKYIPGVKKAIELIQRMEDKGTNILLKTGEEYFSLYENYIPDWSINVIYRLIIKELNTRYRIEELKETLILATNRGAIEDIEEDKKAIKRYSKKRAEICNIIAKERETIDERINSYYSSNYHQAQTILNNIPKYYQAPKGAFNVQDFALLYFFAINTIAPDAKANLQNAQINQLKSILTRIDTFFENHASENVTQCETFINFLANEITMPPNGKIQAITRSRNAYIPIEPKNRFPEFSQNDIFGNPININEEETERILETINSYYEKGVKTNLQKDGIIRMNMSQFFEDIISTPRKDETFEQWRTRAREKLIKLQTCTGTINGIDYFLLSPQYIDKKAGIISFRSPYTEKRHEITWSDAKKRKDGTLIDPHFPIFKEKFLRENRFVKELTCAILGKMIFSKNPYMYYYTPARLIRTPHLCPKLAAALDDPNKTSSEKTRILRDTYKRFYKILESKTYFYDYFLPIIFDTEGNKLPEPQPPQFTMQNTIKNIIESGTPWPTFKYWQDQIITITTGGKNPRFIRPL